MMKVRFSGMVFAMVAAMGMLPVTLSPSALADGQQVQPQSDDLDAANAAVSTLETTVVGMLNSLTEAGVEDAPQLVAAALDGEGLNFELSATAVPLAGEGHEQIVASTTPIEGMRIITVLAKTDGQIRPAVSVSMAEDYTIDVVSFDAQGWTELTGWTVGLPIESVLVDIEESPEVLEAVQEELATLNGTDQEDPLNVGDDPTSSPNAEPTSPPTSVSISCTTPDGEDDMIICGIVVSGPSGVKIRFVGLCHNDGAPAGVWVVCFDTGWL